MPLSVPPNALIALAAAASWGGGDFSGGMGVKSAGGSTEGALRVVIIAHASSLAVLLLVVVLRGDPVPHGWPLFWGLLAGVAAGVSLTAFYIALARGTMGASAALSGILAATIPAIVSIFLEGAPGTLRLAGFALAMGAIWLIAAGPAPEKTPGEPLLPAAQKQRTAGLGTFGLAIVGGVGFGFYFVALRLANPLGVYEPMALARAASLVTCALLLLVVRLRNGTLRERLPRGAWGWAMGIALLDTGGNLLFIAATRLGRLDVAAVLASLYPASTIALAAWRLHERPTSMQGLGMVLAIVAVALISL